MGPITSLFSILSLIISIPYVFSDNSNPVVVVTQGVIKKRGFLPVTVFWHYPNFRNGDVLVVRVISNKTRYTDYSRIGEYIGFHELPLKALEHGAGPDKYCATIESKKGDIHENSSCESKFQWMYDLRDVLRSFTLRDLVIPGSHDSAAYAMLSDESLHDQDSLSRWILSQTKSITAQLRDGIRYLDFRPGFKYLNGRKMYFLVHNQFSLVSLNDVVEEIIEFMDLSKDIVIISFKGFNQGFNSDQDHVDFINHLEFSFRDHVHSRTHWTCKLSKFWSEDRRLILTYDHKMRESSHYLWPPISHYWGDVQTINQLHTHLATVHQNHANDSVPFATLVDFAYSAESISEDLFNRNMGLQEWTERLSRYIPQWYTDEWSTSANIILVNFYQTSGIVDIAIQLNEKRANYSIGVQ